MKTIGEFMETLNGYFDGLKNKFVSDLIINELRYVKPSDLDALFRQLVTTQPASWKPDLKAVVEAIRAAKIDTMNEPGQENKCRVCGHVWNTTGVCPICNYNPDTDGTPDEHRAWWESWKAGREPRFDMSSIWGKMSEKRIALDNDAGRL